MKTLPTKNLGFFTLNFNVCNAYINLSYSIAGHSLDFILYVVLYLFSNFLCLGVLLNADVNADFYSTVNAFNLNALKRVFGFNNSL